MHSFGFGLSFGLTIVHIIKSARERCFLRLLAVIDKKGAFSETCSIILGSFKGRELVILVSRDSVTVLILIWLIVAQLRRFSDLASDLLLAR